MTLRRWNNPVPMPCDAQVSISATSADHWGSPSLACLRDAAWIACDGETVAAFLCHDHHAEVPR